MMGVYPLQPERLVPVRRASAQVEIKRIVQGDTVLANDTGQV